MRNHTRSSHCHVPRRRRRPPRRPLLRASSLVAPLPPSLVFQPRLPVRHRPAPNTSLIASSLFPLTQFHVAFAIATATACMVNCLCVAHAHVFVGCSNLSPHPSLRERAQEIEQGAAVSQCATVAGTFCAPRLASFWAEYSGRSPKRADMGALDTLESGECIAIMEEVV
jgi:hypothetical protein